MFKYVQTCLNNNIIFFYKTVAFKKLFDTNFFYKTVRGVRGVGGGGWVGESRVRWVGGGGRWTWGVLGAEGDRIWRGGIVSMKLKNIHDSSKSTHEIQSRNEGYDLNTIDLS